MITTVLAAARLLLPVREAQPNAVDALLGAAPPAPETVTVDGVTYTNDCEGTWYDASGYTMASWVCKFLTRIASDACVLKDRDARIAELETQLQRALDGAVFHEKRAHHAEQERDDALRALERERAANDTRIEYGTEPRGVVISGTLEEIKGEAGATVAASEPLASESPAATSPSPDPVPLGAVVEVDNLTWEWRDGTDFRLGWYESVCGGFAVDYRAAYLTALYHARHPVATRETVERVAKAIDDTHHGIGAVLRYRLARAALTAAGFTVQEGA